jgi:lysine 2,3-aminomutase
VETIKSLVHGLLKIRVSHIIFTSAILYPFRSCAHIRGKGLEIINGLRGHTTGYAIPTYVIDAPGVEAKYRFFLTYYRKGW